MDWVIPQNSRSRVDAAGNVLIADPPLLDKLDDALTIINNWRSAHEVARSDTLPVRIGLRRHAENCRSG